METVLKIIMLVAAAVAFGWLWRTGQLLRFTRYVEETQEELRKCTWPSKEELKGSTVVVLFSVILLGVFTMGVDSFLYLVFRVVANV
jgi:preprotein translocase SecE subunit